MKYLRRYLFIPFLLIFLGTMAKADLADPNKHIWYVGKQDYTFDGFVLSGKRVVEYQVPKNWLSLINDQDDPNWGFPVCLYAPNDLGKNPQEIIINFCYFEEYNNPILRIWAGIVPMGQNNSHYLELFKDELFIDKEQISAGFDFCDFYLGYIEKAEKEPEERNRIVLRVNSSSDMPILFDSIYLEYDNTDSDGDGIRDADEGDCYLDKKTVCIPIKSYNPDPRIQQRIILHIEDSTPYFEKARFLNPNTLNLPSWLKHDRFLPFDILGFKIKEIESTGQVTINMGYTDKLYSSIRFYAYKDSNIWQELVHEFLDSNTAKMTFSDGKTGDSDRLTDGNIDAILAPAYPKTFDVQTEKRGCFIYVAGHIK